MPRGFECCKCKLPFMCFDTDEMVLLALFQEGNALAHERVGDDHAWPRLGVCLGCIESRDHGIEVVAVDPSYEPAERLQLVDQRLECHELRGRTVCLLVVDIDNDDQVVELVVPCSLARLPDRAFMEFSVGEKGVDPCCGALA